MNLQLAKRGGLIALAVLPLCAGYGQTNTAQPAPTAQVNTVDVPGTAREIVKLSQAGLSDDVVIAFIKNAQSPYNLSAADILALKQIGVSSGVVSAMLNRDGVLRAEQEKKWKETAAPPPVATPAPAPVQTQPPAPVQTPPPPPPRVEVITVAPGPDYYWAPGYWSWRGGAYVWVGGCWNIRPGVSLHVGIGDPFWGPHWGHYRGHGHWH